MGQRVQAMGLPWRGSFCGQPLVFLCLASPYSRSWWEGGAQALVFLARDERMRGEGLVLEGWGWTWEQAACLSQRWVPASLPGPSPGPSLASRVCLREGAGGGPTGRAGASKGGPAGFSFFSPLSFISIAINNPFPRSCPDSN